MDLFLSKTFSDGTVCIDIMKKFLTREFRADLLELYLLMSKNPKSDDVELCEKYPQHFAPLSNFGNGSNNQSHFQIVTLNLLEAFGRLKQTVVYEEEYLSKTMAEIEFVFNSIK
ncbi:predicted protein [Naegleria gruberi]|uniref:Predicted protein n=1 Tax=Naegleria gruberi TaxID=5762 RepID=D2VHH9_NAEGR|nr:uncharacterized protein NAEGRDRAFT_68334 [Naegleria gruberi]EFC43685.1 predicted protein [Naegleria gruberi]|eukprot:XP_002676429.1 predicted protein [Naegleria gruberi strain NEG-M]